MDFKKEAILIFVMIFVLTDGHYNNPPRLDVSCGAGGLSLKIYFKRSFNGTVFADGYSSDSECSSPNLWVTSTTEVKLTLPLLKCGNQIRINKWSAPSVRNKIVVQQHPLIRTAYDLVLNVSCKFPGSLPPNFRTSYQQRDKKQPPLYNTWLEFKLGSDLFGQTEAKMLGVSHKLFLVAHVQDGGRNKDVMIRSCFAHNESIVRDTTFVQEMNLETYCDKYNLLSDLSIRPDFTASNLMGFAEVKSFRFKAKGELHITCGIELCEKMCLQYCSEGDKQRTKHWSAIGTRRLHKRSADGPSPVRALETRNVLLRSTVKVLSEKLLKLKLQLNARANDSNFERRVLDTANVSYTTTSDSKPLNTFSTEVVNTDLNSKTNENMFTEPSLLNTDVPDSSTLELLSNIKGSSGATEPVPTTQTFAPEPTTVPDTIYTETEAVTAFTAVKGIPDEAVLQKQPGGNLSKLNISDTSKETLLTDPPKTPADCVPKLKFVVVTVSLSLLAICLFLICVGLYLHVRKERKKHFLDSYLLYSYF